MIEQSGTPSSDWLEHLFDLQQSLQEHLAKRVGEKAHLARPFTLGMERAEKTTQVLVLAIVDEAMEVLREVSWKPWKRERRPPDVGAIQLEIVDLWHFLLNLSIVWGLTPAQLVREFERKHQINRERADGGY